MNTTKQKKVLPDVLPYGWRTEIAKLLNVHPLTISRWVKTGKGKNYEKVIHMAREKYGVVEQEKQ